MHMHVYTHSFHKGIVMSSPNDPRHYMEHLQKRDWKLADIELVAGGAVWDRRFGVTIEPRLGPVAKLEWFLRRRFGSRS